ncbi:hypothetical protein [Nocardia sp. IFM 10818]
MAPKDPVYGPFPVYGPTIAESQIPPKGKPPAQPDKPKGNESTPSGLTPEQQELADLALGQGATGQPQQPAPVGGVEDLVGLLEEGPQNDGPPVTLPSGTKIQQQSVPLQNGLTTHETLITLPGEAEPSSSGPKAVQGFSNDQLAGLFAVDANYTAEQRNRDLDLLAGRVQDPSGTATAEAQQRLNQHWQRGGLWLADGTTILPDASYSAGQLANDLALASTTGTLDGNGEQLRTEALERLRPHLYTPAAQNADQETAALAYMSPDNPDRTAARQARIDALVQSGIPRDQADAVLWQQTMAARLRLNYAGIPLDNALGDRLAQMDKVAPAGSGEAIPPALVLSTSDGTPVDPTTLESALVPGGPGVAWSLLAPGAIGAGALSTEAAASLLGGGAAGTGAAAATAAETGGVMAAALSAGAALMIPALLLPTVTSGIDLSPMRPHTSGTGQESGPNVNRSFTPGVNPWTHQGPAVLQPNPNAVDPTTAAPALPSDDPSTVHQRVSFPSTRPGQPNVPIEGYYWDNGVLKKESPVPGAEWSNNGTGDTLHWKDPDLTPEGYKPGDFVLRDGKIVLQGRLFKLMSWSFDDIPDQYRPSIMAAMAALNGAKLYSQFQYGLLETMANILGADLDKLTGSKKDRQTELLRIRDRGLPFELLDAAVQSWWSAESATDRASELLGHTGAIAVLESDGWNVKVRPAGNNKHDILAIKDGQMIVIEAKGGKPGSAGVGKAWVPTWPGSTEQILATQMTDPYLWGKLYQDGLNDPEFKQWLEGHGMWDAILNRDATTVGYRLIRTDTDGNIVVYGSTQQEANGGVPPGTDIGKTTGTKPGTPPNPGPTLHGIAQPLAFEPQPTAPTSTSPLDDLLGPAGAWLADLLQGRKHDTSAIAQLAVSVPAVPVLQPGSWPRRAPANQSLTVTITPKEKEDHDISPAELLKGQTYSIT